jgi:uncharacterized protein (DUF2252 family)
MYEPEPDLDAPWSESETTDERITWRRARNPERRPRDLGRNARRSNGHPERARGKSGPAESDTAPPANIVARIQQFNKNREPERLQLKYARMRSNLYCFYRGTPHLFYEDWPADAALDRTPIVWNSGDLHLENFGTYKGDNRLVYFDISDFEDAILAPSAREISRFVSSVLVAARSLGLGSRDMVALAQLYVRSYTAALKDGQARWVERPTARGMVKDLLSDLKHRTRRDLLNSRTELVGRARRLLIDQKRTLQVPEVARARIAAFMRRYAARQPRPEFYKLLDVARRIAGISSLGLPRYVLLVEGEGSPHENYLLDLKFAPPSAAAPYTPGPQPEWKNNAERIVAIQSRMQAIPPALLHPVLVNRQPYVMRELQPSIDRLNLDLWGGKLRRLEKVMGTMGEITAWAQLRSSGRQGSAVTDELIEFGRGDGWQQEVIAYARFYSAKLEGHYKDFCEAYDSGVFGEG